MPNDTPTPDFSSIEGHQIHDPSTISAAKPDTLGLGIQDIDPAHMAMDIGPALDHLTSRIENYTQTGRELHPVLSRLGDATRAAKEFLTGGQAAGKPMGTSSGVLNNPVTQTISMADAAPEVGAAIESGAKKAADYISDARAFHPNPEHGGVPISFDHIPGHQMEAPSGPPTQKELVHVAPKDFIAKTNEGPVHTDTVNHYRQQIRSSEDVGPASISYDADGNIVGANGRHRALAHMQEGTERMPVEIHRPVAETPAKPTPKQIIEDQGLVYKGELTPGSHVHMFEHPEHPGKTAAMNEAENITPESVKTKMASKLKDFGVKPSTNPAGAGTMVGKALSKE